MIDFIADVVRWIWEAIMTLICIAFVIIYIVVTGFMSLWLCAVFYDPKVDPGKYFLATGTFWFLVYGLSGFYASGFAGWLSEWHDRRKKAHVLSQAIELIDTQEAQRRAAKETY